jgi:hypothetical protein
MKPRKPCCVTTLMLNFVKMKLKFCPFRILRLQPKWGSSLKFYTVYESSSLQAYEL